MSCMLYKMLCETGHQKIYESLCLYAKMVVEN